jgi:ATP adenylyltransferase
VVLVGDVHPAEEIEDVKRELIWAPWRLPYVKGEDKESQPDSAHLELLPGADRDCFICLAVADSDRRGRYVVHQDELTITILNKYPYTNGHLLVGPRVHRARLDELTTDEQLAVAQRLTDMVGLLERVLHPEGFNVGLNLGRVAGAGLPGHLHWHIVPRWNGDTNFMSSLASVRVIPQSLEALWEALAEELAEP